MMRSVRWLWLRAAACRDPRRPRQQPRMRVPAPTAPARIIRSPMRTMLGARPGVLGLDTTTLGACSHFAARARVTCATGGATPDLMNQIGAKSDCTASTSSSLLDAWRVPRLLAAAQGGSKFGCSWRRSWATPHRSARASRTPGGGTQLPALAHFVRDSARRERGRRSRREAPEPARPVPRPQLAGRRVPAGSIGPARSDRAAPRAVRSVRRACWRPSHRSPTASQTTCRRHDDRIAPCDRATRHVLAARHDATGVRASIT